MLGVSPEAIRARLDAQTQELEKLRAEMAELTRKSGTSVAASLPSVHEWIRVLLSLILEII